MTGIKFTIIAVKNLCRQEQEDWWSAILADRVARTALFSLREDQKTFQYWAEMAAWPGYDVNVVYSRPANDEPALESVAGAGRSSESWGPSAPVAFFWTCGWVGRGAFLHFGFLSAGLPWKMEIGRYVLKVLAGAGYRCLASLTPAGNIHVVAYGQSLGGRVMGRWPGVCYIAARDEWVDGVLLQFILGPEAPPI